MRFAAILIALGFIVSWPLVAARATPDSFVIDGLPGKPHTSTPVIVRVDPLEIVSKACADGYRMSSFILGVVKSDAFQKKRVEPAAVTTDGAQDASKPQR